MDQNDTQFSPTEAAAALKRIFRPGDVFEIRALDAQTAAYNRPHTVSGYFDYEHISKAVAAIADTIRFARGIYYTPNPVEPALLARAANRFRDMGQRDPSTADKDIPRRRWLLIDCDAIRPSGISSSDAEHAAALTKAAEIRDGLASMGFPAPVEIDSGNGAQLMYAVDLPGGIDDTICKSVLQSLQAVNSPAVDIDETVFNASRIWRLPGSVNCKGDPIPDRPHRRARIIAFPDELQIVPIELLKQAAGIADEKPFDPAEYQQQAAAGSSAKLSGINFAAIESPREKENFEITAWIARYCPEAEGPEPWQDGRKWIFPICPFNPDHRNRSAIITEQANGAIGFTCHHNGCKGKDWRALRKLREPGFIDREIERQQAAEARKIDAQKITQPEQIDIQEPQQSEPPAPAPWRNVTTDEIRGIIEGTLLGKMAELYSCVTVPALPIEAALLKAIVTAGCALSGPGTPDVTKQGLLPPIGVMRARLRINTAGGQVCNVYALLAANSASGKDIGNLLDIITQARKWNLGTSGSAEGIAEALKDCPNGLISISEFANWLDEKHWQHKATSFLTEAFSKGFFHHNFSSRSGKKGTSGCDYCYPNIIANIQPEVFENVVQSNDLSSGFLGRFLYCRMPEFFGDPADIDINDVLRQFAEILPVFEQKHGIVYVPAGYGSNLSAMFREHSPRKLHPVWRRLVNEYMPRLACMLSVSAADPDGVKITDKALTGAALMVQWFFKQAESLLAPVEDFDQQAKQQEKILRRIMKVINRHEKEFGFCTLAKISQSTASYGTRQEERRRYLCELVDRGWIISTVPGCGIGAKFKTAAIPPGIID